MSENRKTAEGWPYFVLVCEESELQAHLAVCRNSDFAVGEDERSGGVAVRDRGTVLLRAERGAVGWLVWLHRAYYRHPFQPASSGDAMPGVP
jgi:hypothetical protein